MKKTYSRRIGCLALGVFAVLGLAGPSTIAQTRPVGPLSSSVRPAVTPVKTVVTGTVNGQAIKGRGEGTIVATEGRLRVAYTFESFPKDVPLILLSPFTITGYPSPVRPAPGAQNPFRTHDLLVYTRTVQFLATGEKLVFKAKCEETDQGLSSKFELTGTAPTNLGEVVAIDPLVEQWTHSGVAREVQGTFPISFVLKNGQRVRAVASSDYTIGAGEEVLTMNRAQHRAVTITPTVEGSTFIHDQVSTMLPVYAE